MREGHQAKRTEGIEWRGGEAELESRVWKAKQPHRVRQGAKQPSSLLGLSLSIPTPIALPLMVAGHGNMYSQQYGDILE
jgi:hypothetical protein